MESTAELLNRNGSYGNFRGLRSMRSLREFLWKDLRIDRTTATFNLSIV
jgi:hypothetical protein